MGLGLLDMLMGRERKEGEFNSKGGGLGRLLNVELLVFWICLIICFCGIK
jgi:hypothetical protein